MKSIVNKKVDKIIHDEFIYTNTLFGHINLFVDNKIYELKCVINSSEFFGETEYVTVLSFNEVKKRC